MSDQYYLTDGGHVLISGATGAREDYGGKTTTANWWFHQSVDRGWHDLGVYLNPKGHRSIKGSRVETLADFAQAYQSGDRLIDYHLTGGSEEHERVLGTLKRLPGEKIVVHDEAQSYSDADTLKWALAQAGNLPDGSIRSLVLTQRPWTLSEELRANMPVKIWCGPLTSEGRKFFETEHMRDAVEKVKENTGPYHWNVTDAGEYQHTNPPVPEDYC